MRMTCSHVTMYTPSFCFANDLFPRHHVHQVYVLRVPITSRSAFLPANDPLPRHVQLRWKVDFEKNVVVSNFEVCTICHTYARGRKRGRYVCTTAFRAGYRYSQETTSLVLDVRQRCARTTLLFFLPLDASRLDEDLLMVWYHGTTTLCTTLCCFLSLLSLQRRGWTRNYWTTFVHYLLLYISQTASRLRPTYEIIVPGGLLL